MKSKYQKPGKLIVHCCHHKVGTHWFNHILNAVSQKFGLKYQYCLPRDLQEDTDIFLDDHSNINFSLLRPYVGSHMIRDPRDVIVSG